MNAEWLASTTDRQVPVLGSTMSVRTCGEGDPVVFLHGNPTSSYLWRHVVPLVADAGWSCLAVDLIGMGRSGKPDLAYRFADHAAYLEALVEALALETAPAVVAHDWGAVLALHHARTHPGSLRAVAICETHIHPVQTWAGMGDGADMFRDLRATGTGEELVLEENFFVDKVLPGGMNHVLTEEDARAYAAPYPDPASRRPILAWVREIPIEGTPADVAAVVEGNQLVITDPEVPTMLMHAEPGSIIGRDEVDWCAAHGRNHLNRAVGPGLHFLPEDCPEEIAASVVDWLGSLARRPAS